MTFDQIGPVYVGGLEYTLLNDADDELIRDNNRVGEHDGLRLTIKVSTKLPPLQIQALTLLHEVFHALGAVYMEGRVLDETDVSALSQGFYQVLVDNPRFVTFLQNPTLEPESTKCGCSDALPVEGCSCS